MLYGFFPFFVTHVGLYVNHPNDSPEKCKELKSSNRFLQQEHEGLTLVYTQILVKTHGGHSAQPNKNQINTGMEYRYRYKN